MKLHSVWMIGCGGTGSQLAESLCRLISYHPISNNCPIFICDGDKLEDKNLTRQNYSTKDVGKNKAFSLHTKMEKVFPGARINARAEYLSGQNLPRSIERLGLPAEDELVLVLGTVDNSATRKSFFDLVESANFNILFMTPGNGLDRGQVLTWAKVNNLIIGDDPREAFPEIAKPKDYIPRLSGCVEEAPSTPQLIAANMMAAAATFVNLQKLLDTGKFWGEIYFDIYKTVCAADYEHTVFTPEESAPANTAAVECQL